MIQKNKKIRYSIRRLKGMGAFLLIPFLILSEIN